MYGGALLISVIALLTLALQIDATVGRFIFYERDKAMDGASLLSSNMMMKEAGLRNAVVNFELTWPLNLTVSEAEVERFEAAGRSMTLQPTPSYEQWIVGAPGGRMERAMLAHYLGTARRLGQVSAANARARGREIRTYYVDVEGRLATILPAPQSNRAEIDVDAVGRRMRALMRHAFADRQETVESGKPRLHWMFPFDNPLVAARTALLGAMATMAGEHAQFVLFEFMPAELMAPLLESSSRAPISWSTGMAG